MQRILCRLTATASIPLVFAVALTSSRTATCDNESPRNNGSSVSSSSFSWSSSASSTSSPSPQPPTARIIILPQRQSKGEQVSYALLLSNMAVYVAWQIPSASIKQAMQRLFTSGGQIDRSRFARFVSPLLACYSHSHLFHLMANMLALTSFAPKLIDGRNVTSPHETVSYRLSPIEFMAMYNIAGIGASLSSTYFSSKMGTGRPGLGASGALFSVIGFYAQAFPEARVMLLFFIEMSAREALVLATVVNGALAAKEILAARGRSEFS
jgi:membrane associated rhomboid family serine protease